MNAAVSRFVVAADHPCLAGHFPGHPIVPAVLLLELAFESLRDALPDIGPLRGVSNAKFLRPVRPGETVTVIVDGDAAAAVIGFRCETVAGLVAQGRFDVDRSTAGDTP